MKRKTKFKVGEPITIAKLVGTIAFIKENQIYVKVLIDYEGERRLANVVCWRDEVRVPTQKELDAAG